MEATELITKLAAIVETDGDLDIIYRTGEMMDPYGVSDLEIVGVDAHFYEGLPIDYTIPWDQDAITNARAVEIS